MELKRLILIIIFITACSSSEKKQKDVIPEQIPTSINSFFDSKPTVIKLDSTLFNSIEKWSQIVSFSEKFSDLIDKEINHNSKIKSLGWVPKIKIREGIRKAIKEIELYNWDKLK